MTLSYISIGANLGDAQGAVEGAIRSLAALRGTRSLKASSLYRTAPVDADGPDFVNAVVELHTTLGPRELLSELQAIEARAGRERPYRKAPRTLDLDIALYGDEDIDTPLLTVPHPRMLQRAFVLVPLAEIAPLRVTREALAAVAHQAIERIPGSLQPAPLPPT